MRGRPKLAQTRNRQLNVGLTDAEYEVVLSRSRSQGLRPVDFARARLFGKGVNAEAATARSAHLDPLLLSNLARIGNNLNQIARQLNALRMPTAPDLEPVLSEIRAILRKVAQS